MAILTPAEIFNRLALVPQMLNVEAKPQHQPFLGRKIKLQYENAVVFKAYKNHFHQHESKIEA